MSVTFSDSIDCGIDPYAGSFEIASVPGSVVIQGAGREVYDANGELVVASTAGHRQSNPDDDSRYCLALG